ncbi:uncharacterized protein LOC112532518 isoform X1 [Gallus gallus]|uniref:uncharacterized protein LOC112532518 isoform X1 n=1 Tax=Gallus gallus TaxID=9031 RepID=UPI001F015E34|nr:uncharacterized protein LOC112532518 isoform X1 [Gallus gallus]
MNIFRYTIYTRVKCLQLVHSMQTTREAKHCFHIADAGAWEAMEIASLGCHGEPSVEGAQFLAFAGKRHQNLPELRAKPWSATTLVQKGIVRNMTEITPVREISFYVAALNREQAEVWAAGKTQLFVCACFPPHSQLHPHVFNPEDTGSVQPQTLFPLARVAWDARRKHGDKTQGNGRSCWNLLRAELLAAASTLLGIWDSPCSHRSAFKASAPKPSAAPRCSSVLWVSY